ETSLLVAGSLVLVGFIDTEEDTGTNLKTTGYARSVDGGTTFTDMQGLPTTPLGDGGDPSLARDNVSGKIYFSTITYNDSNVIQVFRSTDDGATFSTPVNGAPGISSSGSDHLDKDWITVDNASGTGQGNVYLTFTAFDRFNNDLGSYLTRSTNGGDTWSA